MRTQTSSHHVISKIFTIIVMGILVFQTFGMEGRAAPALPAPRFQAGGDPQALACSPSPTPTPTTTYCDVQIVLMIDDSGSMRTNDPQSRNPAGGLRNQGAKNLVDVLATQFYLPAVQLKADNPEVRLPDVRVAVMHFSATLKEYSKEWVQINPGSLEEWEKQRVELYKLIDWKNTYEARQYTHFIEPFAKAAELFKSGEAQVQASDCVRRSIMLFTDGTPEDVGGILQGKALEEEMNKVNAVVQDDLSGLDVRIYVTGFKVNPKYWVNVEPYWSKIVGTPAADETLPRSVLLEGEDSLIQMASRMEEITASLVNLQSLVLTPDAQDRLSFSVVVPKHIQSLRLTLYNLDPQAGLLITGPDGNQVAADGQNVTLSGETSSVEVWQLNSPAPGTYKVQPSKRNGIITGLLTYQNLAVEFAPEPARLEESKTADLKFKLLDNAGNAVLPGDDPAYTLDLKAFVSLAGQEEALTWKQDGDDYQVTWMPKTSGEAKFRVETVFTGADGNLLWSCLGDVAALPVDAAPTPEPPIPPSPPTLAITTPEACVPSGVPIVIPLQLKYDGDRAWTSTLQWNVSAAAQPGGQSLNASVTTVNAGSGDYELRIDPVSAQEIQLKVSAKAEIQGQSVDISDGQTHTIPVCACACDASWGFWFWFLAILLAVLLLILLVLRSRRGREESAEAEGKQDRSRGVYWHLVFWLLLILLILLILNRLFWCCIIPAWLFLALILILILMWIILWLIPSSPVPSDEDKRTRPIAPDERITPVPPGERITPIPPDEKVTPVPPDERFTPIPPDEKDTRVGDKDDLKLIEGIGPRLEKLLNENGIYTFRQLVDADLAEVNRWLDANRFAYIDPKTWPHQAALADKAKTSGRKEDWDEFHKYLASVKGGIAPDEYKKSEKDRKPPEGP